MKEDGMSDAGRVGTSPSERDDALRDFEFALETICARIPPDETHLSGHESTAYQALAKWPEYVKSQRVRRLMGIDEGEGN